MHTQSSPRFAFRLPRDLGVALGFMLGATFGVTGCGPDVPANPTWEDDVRPILAANCVRCHRDPTQNGAPPGFTFENCAGDGTTEGAQDRSDRIAARAENASGVPVMPPEPALALSDRQVEVLQNWDANGAPCTGTGNAAPRFELLRPVGDSIVQTVSGSTLVLRYQLSDRNGDPVAARLFAVDAAGSEHLIAADLAEGVAELRWSPSLPAGSYQLRAEFDDGQVSHDLHVGAITLSGAGRISAN